MHTINVFASNKNIFNFCPNRISQSSLGCNQQILTIKNYYNDGKRKFAQLV